MARRIVYTETEGQLNSLEIFEEIDGLLFTMTNADGDLLGSMRMNEADIQSMFIDLVHYAEEIRSRKSNPSTI
jgi:hypothetical protein